MKTQPYRLSRRAAMYVMRFACIVAIASTASCKESKKSSSADSEQKEASDNKAPTKEPSAPEKESAEGNERVKLMRDLFVKAAEARDFLIWSSIDAAKDSMSKLVALKHADKLPEPLIPMLASMQDAADTFAAAENLREAGDAMALTLARCGACHAAAKISIKIDSEPLPTGEGLEPHMQRHHWAAQEMWGSLISGDAERFASAAGKLEEPQLTDKDLPPAGKISAEDVGRVDGHVHKLAKMAEQSATPEERAEIYGRFLATCATCHKLMLIPEPEFITGDK